MLAWHLGLRYLRKRRAAWLAVAAITLTVAAPVMVIGVTQGFLDILKRQARASESDVTLQTSWHDHGMTDSPQKRQDLLTIPSVSEVAPFVQFYALMTPQVTGSSGSYGLPCLIDGVDWRADTGIGRILPSFLHPQPVENLSAPPLSADRRGTGFLTPAWRDHLGMIGFALAPSLGMGPAPLPPRLTPRPGVVAGRELLYGNGIAIGTAIEIAGAPQIRQFAEISDTIGTGILEIDKLSLVTPLPVAQKLADFAPTAKRAARIDGYRLRTVQDADLDRVANAVREHTGYRADTWLQRRMNMVKSLQYQRNIMAFVMLAIQTIAVFVVYAVFSTLVAEKRHDIGVLLGIGARRRDIAGAFLLAGISACVIGGVLGWVVGWSLLAALNPLSRYLGTPLFPQDVFYSPDAPISWDPRIPLFFIAAMGVIGVFAVALPAWRAARIAPVDILREGG
ncbi:MAG: ABC transporter permease [Planctomycetes bacterium]|nr:ABC transporter permease [Planctomycetota bacterium]